jgi:hypothetical protein
MGKIPMVGTGLNQIRSRTIAMFPECDGLGTEILLSAVVACARHEQIRFPSPLPIVFFPPQQQN